MNDENGLTRLGVLAKQADAQTSGEFDLYKGQLLDILDKAKKRTLPLDVIEANRNRVIHEGLNPIADRLAGKSFVDLCQESAQPAYKFCTPDNFDLEELITHCQCVLRRKQGLIGLAIHYTGNYFLSNFKTRLKVDLHRENVFIAPSITLSASHTTTETGVRLVKRHLLNLSQSDVLVDIVSTDQTAADRFWQKLNSVFDHQSCNRFIVIMAMEPECSFPQGFIPLNPPCCNEGHIFHWVGKIVPQLSLLPSEPDTIINEWTDAVINECSIDGQLYIEFIYEHLEAALNKLKLNPTVTALYDFLEERKQIYA